MFRKDKIHNNDRPQLVRSDHLTAADLHKGPACCRAASVSKSWSIVRAHPRDGGSAGVCSQCHSCSRTGAGLPGAAGPGSASPCALTCWGTERGRAGGARRVCRSAAVPGGAFRSPGVGLACTCPLAPGSEGCCRQAPGAQSESCAAAVCWGVLRGRWHDTNHHGLWLKRFGEAANYIPILAV